MTTGCQTSSSSMSHEQCESMCIWTIKSPLENCLQSHQGQTGYKTPCLISTNHGVGLTDGTFPYKCGAYALTLTYFSALISFLWHFQLHSDVILWVQWWTVVRNKRPDSRRTRKNCFSECEAPKFVGTLFSQTVSTLLNPTGPGTNATGRQKCCLLIAESQPSQWQRYATTVPQLPCPCDKQRTAAMGHHRHTYQSLTWASYRFRQAPTYLGGHGPLEKLLAEKLINIHQKAGRVDGYEWTVTMNFTRRGYPLHLDEILNRSPAAAGAR